MRLTELRRVRPVPATGGPRELVRLVTRVTIAQGVIAGAIGLSFSRRSVTWIVITLMLVAALFALALLMRTGSHAAWVTGVGFQSAYVAAGLYRFVFARYLGGTLFAILVTIVLLHPAVARAYKSLPAGGPHALTEADAIDETAADQLGGHATS